MGAATHHIGSRRLVALAAAAVLEAALTLPACAYQIVENVTQTETRGPSGQVTREAAVIHVVVCNGAGENGRRFDVYEYPNQRGFRAIEPPNYSRLRLGGGQIGTDGPART